MSAVELHSFSSIFIGEAIKNRNQAKDVRAVKPEKTSAFEMVSAEVPAIFHFIMLSHGLKSRR